MDNLLNKNDKSLMKQITSNSKSKKNESNKSEGYYLFYLRN